MKKVGNFLQIQDEQFSLEKTGLGLGLSLTKKIVE